jgi:hypothetical protein
MISRNALLKTYDSVEVLAGSVYFFQDEMQATRIIIGCMLLVKKI